jgi:hypothetical protein
MLFTPSGAPSSLWHLPLVLYIYKFSSSINKLEFGIVACGCTIVILLFWNKETLEVKKVCYTVCGCLMSFVLNL